MYLELYCDECKIPHSANVFAILFKKWKGCPLCGNMKIEKKIYKWDKIR